MMWGGCELKAESKAAVVSSKGGASMGTAVANTGRRDNERLAGKAASRNESVNGEDQSTELGDSLDAL